MTTAPHLPALSRACLTGALAVWPFMATPSLLGAQPTTRATRAVTTHVYVGRDASKAAIVNLSDRLGRARLRLLVDSMGVARIEFLDETGRVVQRIPGA